MSETLIPLDLIDEPEWNSRLPDKEDSIESLGASMVAEGLINAITVEGPLDSGRYVLVTGSRRRRAALAIGWTEIRANVEPATSKTDRIVKNIIENQQRKDLSLFEQARACARLRSEGLKLKEVAQKTGISEQYVSNLTKMYEGLPTLISKAWQDKHEAATFNFLRELQSIKAKTPEAVAEQQIARWQDRVELFEDFNKAQSAEPSEDEGEAPGIAPPKKKKSKEETHVRISWEDYGALETALKKSRVAGYGLAIQAIEVLVGAREKIKGVYPEQNKPEKDED